MKAAAINVPADDEVRRLIDDWAEALRAKDLAGVMAHYAADVVTCDLAPPLRRVGRKALEESLAEWFPTWKGPLGLEIRDLEITAGERLAFCYGLSRLSGTKIDGEEAEIWVRTTFCLRKTGGKWLIVHEHSSVPFYMDGSYKAAVDLKP